MEREYIEFPQRYEEATAEVVSHFKRLGFDRCATGPESSNTPLYFVKERKSDEAWADAQREGTISVTWPYVRSLEDFALTKAIYTHTTAIIEMVQYEIVVGLGLAEIKWFLEEWQEYRRKKSTEVFSEWKKAQSNS